MCHAHRATQQLIVEPAIKWLHDSNPIPHFTKIKTPDARVFLFWWEWLDSNQLRLKPTDLQSAPALQLRRTPNPLVRAAGNRAHKNTMSCVISNELMFASQGYPIQLLSPYPLVRAAGIEPAFQAWKACILAFVLCPQQIQSSMII